MNNPVHILVTVRKPELLPAALLVFETIRIGFPNSPLFVWGNGLAPEFAHAVKCRTVLASGRFQNVPATSHDAWIAACINKLNDPFWICDTDLVFYCAITMPWIAGKEPILFSGRHEPEFDEEFTDTIHVERLHTAVMYLNPRALRMAMRAWMARIPEPWRNSAQFPLIRQNFLPVANARTRFYDTMAGAFHAFGGVAFREEQNEAFEHLHCGSYADEVSRTAPSLKDLQLCHEQIYQDPRRARGLRGAQDQYYKSRAVKPARRKGK